MSRQKDGGEKTEAETEIAPGIEFFPFSGRVRRDVQLFLEIAYFSARRREGDVSLDESDSALPLCHSEGWGGVMGSVSLDESDSALPL